MKGKSKSRAATYSGKTSGGMGSKSGHTQHLMPGRKGAGGSHQKGQPKSGC